MNQIMFYKTEILLGLVVIGAIVLIWTFIQNQRKTEALKKAEQQYQLAASELAELNARHMQLVNDFNMATAEKEKLSTDFHELESLYKNVDIQYRSKLNELSATNIQLRDQQEKYGLLNSHANDLQNQVKFMENQIAELKEKRNLIEAEYKQTLHKLSESIDANVSLSEQKEKANATIAALDAQIKANDEINAKIKESFEISQNELKEQLTNLSEKFVKAGTEDLSKKSQDDLANVVKPLRDELDRFKSLINEDHARQEKRAGAFEAELKNMQQSSLTLSNQAQELTKALRTGAKSQGIWGEQQLERVLESSGLVKDKEFKREVAVKPDSNDINRTGRPDAVVYLPDNHCIVIDAKCSLTAYTRYINAETAEDKEQALKQHVESVKRHVKELKGKAYSEDYRKSLNCPSFVFMFVPLDGALSDALYSDTSLYDTAAADKIYLVSPSSLIPALRVVSNLWMLSEQSEKVGELIRTAQRIWDKFSGIESKLEKTIKSSSSHHNDLIELQNMMSTGKGNLKSQLIKFDKNGSRLNLDDDALTIEGSSVELSNAPSIDSAVNDKF